MIRYFRHADEGRQLSPLLSNLLLDDPGLRRGRFWTRSWRAGDTGSAAMPMTATFYVRSRAAGERVMASVTMFLERKLRLKVNQQKSAVAPVGERQFLGPSGQAREHAPIE